MEILYVIQVIIFLYGDHQKLTAVTILHGDTLLTENQQQMCRINYWCPLPKPDQLHPTTHASLEHESEQSER